MILPRKTPFRRPSDAVLSRARRVLFPPADPEGALLHARQELAKLMDSTSRKWNFDFANGVPLPGRYEWEPVTPIKGAAVQSQGSLPPKGQSKITDFMRPHKYAVGTKRSRRNSAPSAFRAALDEEKSDRPMSAGFEAAAAGLAEVELDRAEPIGFKHGGSEGSMQEADRFDPEDEMVKLGLEEADVGGKAAASSK